MAIDSIGGITTAQHHRHQSGSHAKADPEATASQKGEDLQKQIRNQMESSVTWQILKSNFHLEAEASTSSGQTDGAQGRTPDGPAAQKADTPESPPSSGTQITRTDSLQIEYVSAELHLSQTHVGPDGVSVTQADLTYEHLVLRRTSTVTQTSAPRNPGEKRSDPLALDLNGDGHIQTTGIADGQQFDLNADGTVDKASVVSGGDAFVAIDRDGNGRIDSGAELFGDQTGQANGFEALRAYDSNHDGVIDAQDPAYRQLRLLDWNPDGSQRLRSLEQAGVSAIHLGYQLSDQALNATDSVAQTGSYERSDGSTALAADLLLGFSAAA